MCDIVVAIPTYNRLGFLKRTLKLLDKQTYPLDKFEVIVVDDGSGDDTEREVSALQKSVRYRLKYMRQEHKGPAAARNRAIKASKSKFILFTGDDIFPSKDLVSQHMFSLTRNPRCAILGYVEWSEWQNIT